MVKKIFFILFITTLLCGCTKTNKNTEIKIGVIGNDYPIDRATVSKMMALATYPKNDILALDNVIDFKDVNNNNWYYKYINCAYIKGDMSGILEDKFDPNGNLTITQTQYLIDKYDKNKKIKIDDTNKDKPVSYALWCDIYGQIMGENIQQDELVVLATKKTNKNLKEDYVLTDKGLYIFEGINPNDYLNTKIKVFKRDNDVIAITEILETEPVLNRCYIKKAENNFVEVFVGGATKRLYIKDENIPMPAENILADIKFKNDEALEIISYNQIKTGTINRIDNATIRINNTNYVLDENFKIYKTDNKTLSVANTQNLIIGQDIATFFTKGNENKIYGAIIDKPVKYEKIRVAITNDKDVYFDQIKLTNQNGLKILVKGEEKVLPSLHLKNGNDFNIGQNEIIIVSSANENEPIIFENKNTNFYDKIEITKVDNKYILINEIDLESYVKKVLIANYKNTNLEFLKSLSIVQRTIAINSINNNDLSNIGANLNNSLYKNYDGKNNDTIFADAISQTKGQILTQEDNIISPTYFGFSAGVFSNSGEVWCDKNFYKFPTENKPYLIYKTDFSENIYENLQEEVNANIFYKTKDIDSIEKDSPWFRWTTTLEENEIMDIAQNILNMYKTEKYFIKTLQDNKYIYNPVDDIGKIKDIIVTKRGQSGNIMDLEFVGENHTILLSTDQIIKSALKINSVINNNGEIVKMNNLPSNNFVFDKVYDNDGYIKKIIIYGGGYGHGVGLSIYGAEKMASQNKTYKEILNKYYENIKITQIN